MHNFTLVVKVRVEEDHHIVPVDGAEGLLQTLPDDIKEVLEDHFEGIDISITKADIHD
jgi:hypothetical protein|tara:strand:- start:163 stop:336 length:174 start_codon:yes stop_codon:yes gene_type:complete